MNYRVFHRKVIETVENYVLLSRTNSTLPMIMKPMKLMTLLVSNDTVNRPPQSY